MRLRVGAAVAVLRDGEGDVRVQGAHGFTLAAKRELPEGLFDRQPLRVVVLARQPDRARHQRCETRHDANLIAVRIVDALDVVEAPECVLKKLYPISINNINILIAWF